MEMIRLRIRFNFQAAIPVVLATCCSALLCLAKEGKPPGYLTLARLQAATLEGGSDARSFVIEGTVCARNHDGSLLALQDDSGAVVVELPKGVDGLESGNRVRIVAEDIDVERGRCGIQLGSGPTIELDGMHPPAMKSGSVHLELGMQPLTLEWFNGRMGRELTLEYEGPSLERGACRPEDFWRREGEAAGVVGPVVKSHFSNVGFRITDAHDEENKSNPSFFNPCHPWFSFQIAPNPHRIGDASFFTRSRIRFRLSSDSCSRG